VNELSDGNMDRRYESCHALLDTFSNAVSRSKVLFSDECAIYRSARDRNGMFWSKENPNFTQELEHNPPHVMKRTFERDTAFENVEMQMQICKHNKNFQHNLLNLT
jgi:hypothetical protein